MYHRMYLRRCSMSSISEESETGDDEQLDEEFIICSNHKTEQVDRSSSPSSVAVENCLGDLNSFKEEIREAYEELTTLERQARHKTTTTTTTTLPSSTLFNIEQDELDILLEQLQTLEQRLDQRKLFQATSNYSQQKTMSSAISAQFDELDQALATLTHTLNNVEIEWTDSGNSSSSSSGMSDSTTSNFTSHNVQQQQKQQETEVDEHFSDSGLSQSTESISLPLKQSSQLRTNSQLSNTSSVFSCDTYKAKPSNDNPIRVALEKMHEANIRKMFVKIHNDDQSTKNLLIDETMSINDILILLMHKYRLKATFNHTIVEDLPDLHIYRIFEDHQNLIHDAISYWSRDTNNRICFQQHSNHYSIFNNPKEFFSTEEKSNASIHSDILPDYISADTIVLPDDIQGVLFIKDKTRKIWKKSTCVLRQSGIYQIPKASSSKGDLICLIKFDSNMQLYHARNWMETLRSPTSFGFALKYAHIQKKSNKYIHYICTNTMEQCQRWINGIRVIQNGIQLYKNYQKRKTLLQHDVDSLVQLLPNQHYFNFIQSNPSPKMSQSNSIISLPINRIVSDASPNMSKSFIDLEHSATQSSFRSLDRLKISKSQFTRSSSFHSSLRRPNKSEQKLQRTYSTSPPDFSPRKNDDFDLKRSKSSREILSKSSMHRKDSHETTKSSSTSSIIPFIHQCIQAEKTMSPSKVPPLLPPKRPPPPIPKKSPPMRTLTTSNIIIDNHIYDSFQDSPPLITHHRKLNEDNRTVPNSRALSMRVTEL